MVLGGLRTQVLEVYMVKLAVHGSQLANFQHLVPPAWASNLDLL